MRIKKILFAFLLLFVGALNVFAKDGCSDSQIQELRNALKDVTLEYEIMPEGSTYEDPQLLEMMDASNLTKVEFKNIPANQRFYILIDDSETQRNTMEPIAYLPGGVYTIKFFNFECETPIKSYQVMIPIYNPKNKDNVWFDGTYTPTTANFNTTKEKVNTRLVIILIILIIIIILIIAFIVIKRREHNYEN